MIAITGAAGFIGSNLAHRLAREGHALLLADREVTPLKTPNLAGLPDPKIVGHDQFLQDLEAGRTAPEAIFHLGACSRTTETRWDYLVEVNIRYTQRLWNWCAANGKPLIYASSAATYGDGAKGFDDRTPPDQLTPLNLYGRSKNDFDMWALNQVETNKPAPPRWAGMKFFNVFGPRELHKGGMASVVWQARKQILKTGAMRLFKSNDPAIRDGEQRRDFVFVNDCIEHMLWLWRNPAPNALYNSGTGTARTFFDLIQATFAALGRPPRIEFIDMPPELSRQYQNYTQADMSKLRSAGFGEQPTDLAAGVSATLAGVADSDRPNLP